jgi:ribosomal protein S24E
MELAVKGKKENKSLGRTEIVCSVSFSKAMPSRKEIREAICAATGVAPELLAVVSVRGSFGSRQAEVIAHAYKDKQGMAAERSYLLVRDGLAEKKKKADGQKGAGAPAKKGAA